VGSLTLGTVPGAPTITPIQIAGASTTLTDAQKENVTTNLLVLLQSLDSDRNHANGITINAAAATAMNAAAAAPITAALTGNPVTFAAVPQVATVATAGGGAVVQPQQALGNFETAFLQDLSGVYFTPTTEPDTAVFRFYADGRYIMGDLADTDNDTDSTTGVERGTITWNPASGQMNATTNLDTNGTSGFGLNGNEPAFFKMSGTSWVASETANGPAITLPRLNQGAGIVGAWSLDNDTEGYTFIFDANGRYVMLDPLGDTEANPCGGPGVELGTYTLTGTALAITITRETNGCSGLSDSGAVPAIQATTVDANTVRLTIGGDDVLLRRIN
jgi:hypothetical protein